MVDTSTIERTDQDQRLAPDDGGDHDRFAHYVVKDKITESIVTGVPVTALCGKKWIPFRSPDGYPVCPQCKSIRDRLPDHEK